MKKTLLTLAFAALSAVATYAQSGSIQFLNTALNKIKYLETSSSTAVDLPAGAVVGVFYGSSANSLSLADATTKVTSAGLFNGGAVYLLPGTAPGESVFLKIAAWYNSASPSATPALARDGAQSAGITHYGESATVQTTALGPTSGPGTVVWQSASGASTARAKPFNVVEVVPEPSVVALGALGLGALLLRRRKA